MEIIEFPAVIIDTNQKKILYSIFHFYVKQIKYPKLSEFCTTLTGMTQEQVDEGTSLGECIRPFELYLKTNNVLDKNFIVVTDGNKDLESFLKENLNYLGIEIPEYLKYWINLKTAFNRHTGETKKWDSENAQSFRRGIRRKKTQWNRRNQKHSKNSSRTLGK
jgi:inhibitor of KinA sporulation pathway (predicted exonuclease)